MCGRGPVRDLSGLTTGKTLGNQARKFRKKVAGRICKSQIPRNAEYTAQNTVHLLLSILPLYFLLCGFSFAVFIAVFKVFLLLRKIVIVDIVDNGPKLFRARYTKIVV